MKTFFLPSLLLALALGAGACQKQQTEEERHAEVERRVQERLAGEHQAQKEQELTEREADLNAREEALAKKADTPTGLEPPATAAPPSPQTETATYATFYRRLDPYGDWLETSNYGYVFQPRAAVQNNDWRPYTVGHWVYTDAGWTWISGEKFGWATYHYGRWVRLRGIGWVWVPGRQWAPAWVSWRRGNHYVGWAPLPPEAEFDHRTGIHNWADSYYDIGPEQYNFVAAVEFGKKLSPREIVPPQQNLTIINQTINVTNITYNNSTVVDRGPSYDELRAHSRQPIERLRLERTRNLDDERPVIRGEVVALPAIDFNPPQNNTRPNRVARRVGQTTAERGWSGIRDQQAARTAREKIKAEATPPANLPRKVSPNEETAPSPATPTPTPAASVTATPPAHRNRAAIAKEKREQRERERAPRQAEQERRSHGKSAAPRTRPTPPPAASTPAPASPAAASPPDPGGRGELQDERREQRQRERAARQTEQQQRMLEKRGSREEQDVTPSATPTPRPSASPSPTQISKPSPTPGESTTPAPSESPSPSIRPRNRDRFEHKRKPGGSFATPQGPQP